MPPRPSDPRRGSRGGVTDPSADPAVAPLRGSAERGGGTGRSGIGDARRYTPRGRSIREADAERGQRSRGGDPFRPALQVVKGGADERAARGGRAAAARTRDRAGAGAATVATVPAPARSPRPEPAVGRGVGAGRGIPAAGRSAGAAGGRAGAGTPTKTRGRPGAGRLVPPARRPVRRPKRQVRLPDPRRRLRLASVLMLVAFVVIGGRLVELQLMDAKAYAARGLHNRIQTVSLPAPRGAIYDRDRKVLVHSVKTNMIIGDPTQVKDPQATARQLAPLLGKPVSELLPKLTRHTLKDGTPVQFEYLARGVDISVGEKINALNLAGVTIDDDERRDVPGHDLAANLLGFTNYNLSGVAGIEQSYDKLLRGVPGQRTFESGGGDVATEIPGGLHKETPARPGSSLQLTIDSDLQFHVQSALSQQAKKAKATFASAVVMDVRTGEVLAQASYPGYDAAEPTKANQRNLIDANTDLVVDPGSVAKAITLGAALQEGVVKPDTTVPIGPTIRKGDTTYSDTHPLPEGTRITLPGILAYSSNVGTIKIADQLGPAKLYEYQQKFGLGTTTGEGLSGESAGLIQPPKNWSGSSYGSVPIGMGISTTPLQMTAAYAAIANGGEWVQPHLVKAEISADGKVTPAPAPKTRRVLSTQTADALRGMLEAVVVADGATGHKAAVPGYRVAGKTGTGKFVGPDGKYAPGDVASFIGMAPADAPRYVIGVFAHTPKGEGGDISAPAFSDMMAFTLGRNQVPPTGTQPPPFRITG
ncbi:peptidoglycan D,D-transpeptidase FtsI family protein [Planosporangium sp. 12N6]|uniref:peptidoglycan D,D-transpeptidase FtsI family protein n=1 Tax=Planosporangium spinosum TaxID=3402278 RepID=UPI003CED6ACC